MKDRTIIELFFRRDEQGIVELEKEYGKKMKSSAKRYLQDDRDVEEVYNDTLVTLWDSIPPEHPKVLGAYITTVLKRKVIDRIRYASGQKRSRQKEAILEEFDELLNYAGSTHSAEDAVIDSDTDVISGFLKTETQTSRRIFLKRYCFGKSISEIAKEHGMTEAAVYTRLSRTKSRLSDYLKKEGYTI